MYNTVCVYRGTVRVAIFPTDDAAEMYINLMKEKFGHLDYLWSTEKRYIEGAW